jgi:hypothetical protein
VPAQPNFIDLKLLDAEPEWLGSKGNGHLDETLTAAGQEETEDDISIVWGVIRYHDAFGKHETTFGFRVFPEYRFERMVGLIEYNKIT